ncbi:DUF262 domain-containing protein [Chryseobacterium nepalense]|uniref:DUF262 domain-containing protein n=1 Tax=Chryseobacterium nepalense TaxID=1854498 RepID=A0ABY4K3Z8_9FLAO|nr:DUF262 domain-containing protein [Chryseobacterium nepalense]UPQ75513.1 DUF262 domain-containing protein [Chryseobacterium nepalense]
MTIQEQLDKNRRTVSFDNYDITVRQLYTMIVEHQIELQPEYQRHFIWDDTRQSQLIESIFLGIPVPNLFMATNLDSSWEVIDGLQRLTTIVNFVGDQNTRERINPISKKLKINNLDKLSSMNNYYFEQLPLSVQQMFFTRPIRVTVLNDKSDFNVRYDLFERLNTGGVTLHPQEIRNCVYLGEFKDFIIECSKNENFNHSVKMTESAERNGNREELVLKFFAYYEQRNIFDHSVKEFLNNYMERKTKRFENKIQLKDLFSSTFETIRDKLPNGIVRGNRINITPLVLFEAISIGVADVIISGHIANITTQKLNNLLNDDELKRLTTGATNSRNKLNGRIDYVKNYLID